MKHTIRLYSTLTTKAIYKPRRPSMAPSVLGIGIPATAPGVPAEARAKLQEALDFMESDMNASPYDWEMFYFTPDMSFDLLSKKLKTKNWDVVMVGMGLRTGQPHIVQFFQKIVNMVHKDLPDTKFAFNVSIPSTQESCKLALES